MPELPASYVVVGPPAAGKSTVARLLAGSADRGVHVPVDDLRTMVVSGLVLPNPDWSPALVGQVTAARRVALAALAFYRTDGFRVVIDDFVDPPGLREYDGAISGGLATGVVLRPDPEVAVARARHRETTPEGAAYITEGVRLVFSVLDDLLPRLTSIGWQVVDNTDLDPEQTAAAIQALSQ
ncbi:AAA family ATPase [Nocardioides bigeumensis]|uniref:AAA family ATPase n=1 Tax=Nocardioides bigeumensis TaxID=433657 RepID=A0ABN2Z095_9ACTN